VSYLVAGYAVATILIGGYSWHVWRTLRDLKKAR
jgi:CcmD family protein